MRFALRLPGEVHLAGHRCPAGELALVEISDAVLPASDVYAASRHIVAAALNNPHLVALHPLDPPPAPAATPATDPAPAPQD